MSIKKKKINYLFGSGGAGRGDLGFAGARTHAVHASRGRFMISPKILPKNIYKVELGEGNV